MDKPLGEHVMIRIGFGKGGCLADCGHNEPGADAMYSINAPYDWSVHYPFRLHDTGFGVALVGRRSKITVKCTVLMFSRDFFP